MRGSPSLVGSRPAKSVVRRATRVQIPHPAPLLFISCLLEDKKVVFVDAFVSTLYGCYFFMASFINCWGIFSMAYLSAVLGIVVLFLIM